MKYISYEEAKQKGLDLLKKYCSDEPKEETQLPNHYFTGTLENGEELNIIVMQFGEKCVGFGIGMYHGLVIVTHEPHIYIDKVIADYESKVLEPMLNLNQS